MILPKGSNSPVVDHIPNLFDSHNTIRSNNFCVAATVYYSLSLSLQLPSCHCYFFTPPPSSIFTVDRLIYSYQPVQTQRADIYIEAEKKTFESGPPCQFSDMQHQSHPMFIFKLDQFLLITSLLFCFCFVVNAQAPIPTKFDGFWYLNRPAKVDSVLIEAFFDPVCPDSRDSWKPLKEALQHYGSRISLVVHTFPLPYHDNSFLCSRALHIVDKLNSSSTYPLLESFFEQQEKFYGRATSNFTRISVVDSIAEFAAATVGSSYSSAIKLGFNDTKTDLATRISFKYGCLKGVYGTPFFFVNGFPLPDAGSALDYKGWKRIIDPLIVKDTHTAKSLHFF